MRVYNVLVYSSSLENIVIEVQAIQNKCRRF
jgi:hypothetical protein